MTIGKSIKLIRTTRANQNQKDFAKSVGIGQTHLSQVENGKKQPSQNLLDKISKHVGIPVAILFWYGVEESDIKEGKLEAYRTLKPTIDSMINSII